MQEYYIKISSNKCFEYLLESPHWGDSHKYPKHTFYGVIRIKRGLSYISLCPFRILCNSKFILMARSLETNAVVVTRGHCTCIWVSYRHLMPNLMNTCSITSNLYHMRIKILRRGKDMTHNPHKASQKVWSCTYNELSLQRQLLFSKDLAIKMNLLL